MNTEVNTFKGMNATDLTSMLNAELTDIYLHENIENPKMVLTNDWINNHKNYTILAKKETNGLLYLIDRAPIKRSQRIIYKYNNLLEISNDHIIINK